MTDIGLTRGQILYIQWPIKLDQKPANHVVLNINGASVELIKDDQVIAIFTQMDKELILVYEQDWFYRLIVENTEWMPIGDIEYDFTVLDLNNNVLSSDNGVISVYE